MTKKSDKKSEATEERKYAAITGASAGIGYELAKVFAANGYDLLIVAEDERIHEVVPEIERLGAKVDSIVFDLSKRRGVHGFYQAIQAMGRPLDAAALNAGVGVGGAFIDNDIEEEIDMINLNVTGLVQLSKWILKDMVKRGEGKVLYTSSIASTTPGPYLAVYHATKAFVQSFVQGVREELKESGVTLTALMPGATETEFFERAGMQDTKIATGEKDLPGDVAMQGFKAMIEGKDHVVGGSWKNTAEVLMARVTSEEARAHQAGEGSKPGSASESKH